jgi:hypothetical protein
MDRPVKVCTVFLASPSDVCEERRALREVVSEVNHICLRSAPVRFELFGWEDTTPGVGRAQDLINEGRHFHRMPLENNGQPFGKRWENGL